MSVRGKINRNNDFKTPIEAWKLIEKHLPQLGKVWCPFWLDGDITWDQDNIIHTHKDFFEYQPDDWDCIVDNPPYSIKEKVLDKCIAHGKPFALLLPIDTLERKYFRNMVESVGDFSIIIPKNRYTFTDKKAVMFKSCWFCFRFKLKDQLIYE